MELIRNMPSEKEIAILECLGENTSPMGSWNLLDKLEKRGMPSSSATVGRVLNHLEHKGYARKVGASGRMITQKGLEYLSSVRVSDHIQKHTEMLELWISTDVLEDYLRVLEARRAIEREAARLAAANIKESELCDLKTLLEEQEKKYRQKESVAEIDVNFHRLIAHASRNKVLEVLYSMLFSYGQQSSLFEEIRNHVNATYMVFHWKIYDTLRAHDQDSAEAAMVSHIEALMVDVRKYWSKFYNNAEVS
jgi:transcriptional regulator of heat shock response